MSTTESEYPESPATLDPEWEAARQNELAGLIQMQRASDMSAGLPSCRVCGCTPNAACGVTADVEHRAGSVGDAALATVCTWVESDLCSACVPTRPTIPHAWENEDGDVAWIEGHVEPALALLACVVTTMVDVGDEEAMQLLVGGTVRAPRTYDQYAEQLNRANDLLNSTRHVWLKQDPHNEENMLPAEPTDFGAEAYTRVDLR